MSNYKKRFMKIFVCILVAMFVILCICSGFKDMVVYAETNEESEGLSDSEILQYYEKPNIEQDFENDKINIIIKEKYNKLEIGFDTFKCIDSIATIESITYKTEKIYYGASKVIKLCGEKNPIITLELITKEKIIILDAVSKLQDEEIILIAEPSYLYEPEEQWIPEDPYYASQWGLNDINGINAEDAWDCGRGDSSGIKVGIMESGAEVSHEDLQGRVFYGNFTPEEGTKISHGTHVAGIIGAKHNSVGIAGVSQPYMYILNRSSADFAESLIYAEQNDIKIINASFSYIVKDTGEYASFSATHYAALSNYSGLFIASAGNDAVNIDINRMYPACYAVSNVITVGSLDSNDTRSSFSNYGENSVDIYAPGDNIISTLQNNQYGYKSGTSMAAPHVAGLAALLLDTEPALSANRLKEIILDIYKENPYDKILLLGRYNKDIDYFYDVSLFKKSDGDHIILKDNKNIDITYLTIHKSKGLGFDQVIILNTINAKRGFPSMIKDEPVISLLSKDKEEPILYPEERRLFYVALTRTKNKVYILCPYAYKERSSFIKEISEYDNVVEKYSNVEII